MKAIKPTWRVSDNRFKQLRQVARSWGHKTIEAYVKRLVEVKIGKI